MGRRWPKFARADSARSESAPADVGLRTRTASLTSAWSSRATIASRITRSLRHRLPAHFGQLNIQPGSEVHESIVCPKVPPDRVDGTDQVRLAG